MKTAMLRIKLRVNLRQGVKTLSLWDEGIQRADSRRWCNLLVLLLFYNGLAV